MFRVEVSSSWFGGTRTKMGSLNATERRAQYKAQELDYTDVLEFPGPTPKSCKTKEKAIRFLCIVDAATDPNSDGYWMKLSQWNSYRCAECAADSNDQTILHAQQQGYAQEERLTADCVPFVSVSVLECTQCTCLFGPRCTQHSTLSKSSALACTRNSVHKFGYTSKYNAPDLTRT